MMQNSSFRIFRSALGSGEALPMFLPPFAASHCIACGETRMRLCRVDKKKLLSRCSQCNSAAIRRVEQAEIQHVVDAKVFKHVNRFWQCQDCDKVFWVGPKSGAAVQNILGMMLDKQ